jgi:flagellar protein FlaG
MNIDTSTASKPVTVAAPTQVPAEVAAVAKAPAPTPPPEPRPSPATMDAIRAAAKQIDSFLKSIGRSLDIRVDDDTGRTVVTVRDANSGDVIRQIPSEEALKLARSLGESSAAILDLTA